MEPLIVEADAYISKIKLLEEFTALYLRTNKIGPQLRSLNQKTREVHKQMVECKELMQKQPNLDQDYEEVLHEMLKQQLQIINYLEQKMKKKMENKLQKQFDNFTITPKCDSVVPANMPKSSRCLKFGETPRMYLKEYQESPLVRKVHPIPFQLLDFEATITSEMFETIPKYMRGRETINELTDTLENIVIPCFSEKYQLLYRQRDSLRNHADIELWKMFREQAAYVPGRNFITQGDISRKIKKMIDKRMYNKFVMLRHIGILQELRKGQTVCYIWTAN